MTFAEIFDKETCEVLDSIICLEVFDGRDYPKKIIQKLTRMGIVSRAYGSENTYFTRTVLDRFHTLKEIYSIEKNIMDNG